MIYRIEIHYITGDSFGSQETTSFLDPAWEDINIAKENLKAIREHWEFYYTMENSGALIRTRGKTKEEIFNEYKDRWWMVPDFKLNGYDHHRMRLKMDNGNFMQQSNFWCGYFESLIGAKITPDKSEWEFEI